MLGDLDDLGCSAESESKIKLSATLLRPELMHISTGPIDKRYREIQTQIES